VNSVNDVPVNTVPGAQTVNEDTSLSIAGISVNDVDGNLSTTRVTVTNGTCTNSGNKSVPIATPAIPTITPSGSVTICTGNNVTLTANATGATSYAWLKNGNPLGVTTPTLSVNAAGSYYAMIACLAAGMAVHERGRRRALWSGFAAMSVVGLWLTESRSALGAAAAVAVVAVTWIATNRAHARTRVAVLAAVVLTVAAAAGIRVRLLDADPTYRGSGFRAQFSQTSARMIRARPLFGLGVGQYYRSSPLFLSPQLAFTYGAENGHNYFLQIGAELGLIGLGLFVAWLGAGLARAWRALTRAPGDARLFGIAAGVMLFLVTCLTGHPLLLGEVAYPFWMQFGLMTALAGSTLLNGAADREKWPSLTPIRPR